MTIRVPLVLGTDGLQQQLQSGDSIAAPINTPSIRAVANGETSPSLNFGMPVYAEARPGQCEDDRRCRRPRL